jgi:hypothetical protein
MGVEAGWPKNGPDPWVEMRLDPKQRSFYDSAAIFGGKSLLPAGVLGRRFPAEIGSGGGQFNKFMRKTPDKLTILT